MAACGSREQKLVSYYRVSTTRVHNALRSGGGSCVANKDATVSDGVLGISYGATLQRVEAGVLRAIVWVLPHCLGRDPRSENLPAEGENDRRIDEGSSERRFDREQHSPAGPAGERELIGQSLVTRTAARSGRGLRE